MEINLNYVDVGRGLPLVLLHGNGEDLTYFTHQIEYFKHTYRVIAIDTRGHGKSPRGQVPFTIRQFADDLYDFFQDHQIEKAHILGFSDGGNIAMLFALKYPQCVNRLILNGSNLNPSGVKAIYQLPITGIYKLLRLFAPISKKAEQRTELFELMVNDPNVNPSELASIQVKTLVIVGTKDMIKKVHTELIYASLPNASLEFIEGNHFIANQEYEVFNKKVDEFLK
jgi:pimeloyl-ACP methyl ester carboxylesterase